MPIHFALVLNLFNTASERAGGVVLPLYALAFGAQPLAIGFLAATFSVLSMLLSWPAGKLADRFGARWLLVLASVGAGAGMLAPYFIPGLPAIFFAAAMMGLTDAVYSVSLQNLVGLASNPQNRAQHFSNFSVSGSVGNSVGPLIMGLSIDYAGHAWSCLYLAVFTAMPALILAIWGGVLPGGKRPAAHLNTADKHMLFDPAVRKLLATSSLLNSGRDLFQFYMPVYAHAIGLSASAIGGILSMNSVAAFVVRAALARLVARFKEQRLLFYAFLIGAACLALIPLSKNVAVLVAISFIFGLSSGCCQPILTMLMFSNSPAGRSGEALGLRMTVNHLTKLVGPVVFGSVGSAFGFVPMFWISSLMLGTGGWFSRGKKTL